MPSDLVQLCVDGKPFRCHCGGNVWRISSASWQTKPGEMRYQCNTCSSTYGGLGVTHSTASLPTDNDRVNSAKRRMMFDAEFKARVVYGERALLTSTEVISTFAVFQALNDKDLRNAMVIGIAIGVVMAGIDPQTGEPTTP